MSIFVNDPPIKVDKYLTNKYGFCLWEFCYCLENMLIKEYAVQSLIYQASSTKEKTEKLKKIKSDLLKKLDKHQKDLAFARKASDTINSYKLKPFLNVIDEEIKSLLSHRLFDAKKNLKSHLQFHNKIASIWAQVIKKDKASVLYQIKEFAYIFLSTKGIDWDTISDLLLWFRPRFKKTKYSLFFRYKDIDPDVLRRQYYKYKGKYKETIELDTSLYMIVWKVLKFSNKSSLNFALTDYHPLPKEFPPWTIKISKDKIEKIDYSHTGKKYFIIFPTGETLP